MLDSYLLLPILSFHLVATQSCEYDHPAVFDPHFYLNTHPDLEHHNLHTKVTWHDDMHSSVTCDM